MTESVEDEEEPTVRVQRVIARQLMVICTLAVMATLYFAQAVFIPLAMAVVLYLLFRPVVQWLCRRRVPAMVSASLCLLSVGVLGVVCVLPLVSAGQDWLTELPQQMDRAKGRLTAISKPLENISGTWAKVEKMAVGGDERLPQQVVVQQPELTGRTILLSTTTNMLGSLLVVVVMVFFLLTSGDQLLNRLIEQFPSFREKRRIVELILSVQNGLSFYLFTITQINLAFGLAIGLAMWAFGLPNPALWG
ncbi:MAG TPA: AI-2E family transporter, partial [Pirellulales bacterium]